MGFDKRFDGVLKASCLRVWLESCSQGFDTLQQLLFFLGYYVLAGVHEGSSFDPADWDLASLSKPLSPQDHELSLRCARVTWTYADAVAEKMQLSSDVGLCQSCG